MAASRPSKVSPSASGSFGSAPLLSDNMHGPGAVKFTEPTVVNGHVYAAGESISNNNYNNKPGLCGTLLSQGNGAGCYGAVTVWY
jgi:hypothetical protein